MPPKKLIIENQLLEQAFNVVNALNDETRLRILKVIDNSEPISVGRLPYKVKKKQSTISFHLKILAESGLVKAQRLVTNKPSSKGSPLPNGEKLFSGDKRVQNLEGIYYHSKETYYLIDYEKLLKVLTVVGNLKG